MDAKQALARIITYVRQDAFYIPRDYQTIGGMWTVETWERDGIRLQIMDEGYTTRIISPSVRASCTYDRPIEFDTGAEADLIALAEQIQAPSPFMGFR